MGDVHRRGGRAPSNATGARAWTFGTLPRIIEPDWQGHTLRGYPALVDEGDSVAVRVLPTEMEQRRAMWSRYPPAPPAQHRRADPASPAPVDDGDAAGPVSGSPPQPRGGLRGLPGRAPWIDSWPTPADRFGTRRLRDLERAVSSGLAAATVSVLEASDGSSDQRSGSPVVWTTSRLPYTSRLAPTSTVSYENLDLPRLRGRHRQPPPGRRGPLPDRHRTPPRQARRRPASATGSE